MATCAPGRKRAGLLRPGHAPLVIPGAVIQRKDVFVVGLLPSPVPGVGVGTVKGEVDQGAQCGVAARVDRPHLRLLQPEIVVDQPFRGSLFRGILDESRQEGRIRGHRVEITFLQPLHTVLERVHAGDLGPDACPPVASNSAPSEVEVPSVQTCCPSAASSQ